MNEKIDPKKYSFLPNIKKIYRFFKNVTFASKYILDLPFIFLRSRKFYSLKGKGKIICCMSNLSVLSGSGKTTIALSLKNYFDKIFQPAYVLDGDVLRLGLNSDLGFSSQDRAENIRRVGEVAALFVDAGMIAIVSLISPYEKDRLMARKKVPEGLFYEVFLDAPLEVCERRDPKELYKKARSGEIKSFTGISAPYEKPRDPELVLDTETKDLDFCVKEILKLVL